MNVSSAGVAADRVVDQRAADAGLGEHVVVEPVAEHPLVAARSARAPRRPARRTSVQRARVHEVGAAGAERAEERVQVAVGDARARPRRRGGRRPRSPRRRARGSRRRRRPRRSCRRRRRPRSPTGARGRACGRGRRRGRGRRAVMRGLLRSGRARRAAASSPGRGTLARSSCVYCVAAGASSTCAVGPRSTTRPRCMTIASSVIWRTTARSWLIRT